MSFYLCGLFINLSPKETTQLAGNWIFEKHPKIKVIKKQLTKLIAFAV